MPPCSISLDPRHLQGLISCKIYTGKTSLLVRQTPRAGHLLTWCVVSCCRPLLSLEKFVHFSMLQLDELVPFLQLQHYCCWRENLMCPKIYLNLSLAFSLSLVKGECPSIILRGTIPVSLAFPREPVEFIVMQPRPILPFLLYDILFPFLQNNFLEGWKAIMRHFSQLPAKF